ncbi:MAG TPA: hypothetical protein VJ373_05160 [Desulfatiglandales bacterium]|nr:hypothetical protein [Desulfatiglandales bacterium]
MKRVTGFSLLMVLFPFLLGIGCGTVKSAYRASAGAAKSVTELVIPEKGDSLRKRILVASVINRAGIKEEEARRITGNFVELLSGDEDLMVNLLYDIDTSDSGHSSPQYSIIIDPKLVKKAEVMGMDMLITATLDPFDVRTKKSGIWPFRKMKKLIDISMSMNLLDITYGTLILADTKTKMIKIDYVPAEGQDNRWDADIEILDEELFSILDDYAFEISDRLDSQRWTGKIVLLEDETETISGGKNIGVTEGNIFEVFDKGEPIRSLDGRDYFYLGPKMAEIRADEVMQEYSLVVPLNNEKLRDGQLVRLKR